MLRFIALLLFVVATLCVIEQRAWAAYEVPAFQGPVADPAGLLSADERKTIEENLRAYRTRTTKEVVVYVVGSFDGSTLESIARASLVKWNIGNASVDREGIMLLVAPIERQSRIETTPGAHARLSDEDASAILKDRVRPLLQQNKIAPAVQAGIEAIESHLDATAGTPNPTSREARESAKRKQVWTLVGLISAFMIPFGIFLAVITRKEKGSASQSSGDSTFDPTSIGSSSSSSSDYSGLSGGASDNY